jgi:hypothetical protein
MKKYAIAGGALLIISALVGVAISSNNNGTTSPGETQTQTATSNSAQSAANTITAGSSCQDLTYAATSIPKADRLVYAQDVDRYFASIYGPAPPGPKHRSSSARRSVIRSMSRTSSGASAASDKIIEVRKGMESVSTAPKAGTQA